MIWLIFLFSMPSIVEAWFDRNGEARAGKIKDSLILIGVSLLLSLAVWLLLRIPMLKSIALLVAWRLLIFDYLSAYLLIRNGVIVGKWWGYSGKTSKWDGIIAHIDWRLRLLIRVILFGVATVFFLQNHW